MSTPLDIDLLRATAEVMEAETAEMGPTTGIEEFMKVLLELPSSEGVAELTEVAVGRAMMALGLATEADIEAQSHVFGPAVQLFLDGFTLGLRYSRNQAAQA